MRIDRLCFEFDDGETPTRMIVRSEDRYDLYYVAKDPDGHCCDDPRCREIVPPLARKRCWALVSYDKRKTLILNEDDRPIRLIPGVEAVAVLLDLSMPRDVVEYSKCFPVQIERDGIRVLDENGKPGERLDLGVYHVKDADGEWSTLPKHSDLREVVKKYGGDDHHKVY